MGEPDQRILTGTQKVWWVG